MGKLIPFRRKQAVYPRLRNEAQLFPKPRSKPWYRRYYGFIALIVSLALAVAWHEDQVLPMTMRQGSARVIDGDSLRMNGTEYRLKGIDAPELRQTCNDAAGNAYSCGEDAKRALGQLIGGRTLKCQDRGADRYGRTLAYCQVGETDVNHRMVELGMAVEYGRFSYIVAELEARNAGRGIWQGEFERPQDWRERHRKGLARGDLTGGDIPAD